MDSDNLQRGQLASILMITFKLIPVFHVFFFFFFFVFFPSVFHLHVD